jgi:O-antigen/teichoic acid export membrane protein
MTLAAFRLSGQLRRLADPLRRLRGGLSASGLYFGDRMFALAAGFIANVLFARNYGLEDVGQYLYVLTTVQIASATLQGSCEPIIIRDLVRHGQERDSLLGTCFAMLSALSIAWTGVIAAIILLAQAGDQRVVTMTLILASQYIFLGFGCVDYLFKSRTDAWWSAGARVVVNTLLLAGRVFVILNHLPLVWVAAASAMEGLLTALIFSIAYLRAGGSFARWRFDRRRFVDLLRQALTASVSMVMVVMFFRIGILLVEHFDGFSEVGRLALAIQVASVADILPAVAATAFYPKLVALHDASFGRFTRLLAQIFRLAAGGSYISAIGVAVVVAPVAVLVFGHKFAEIQAILVALSLNMPSNWSGMVRAHFINIIGRQTLHVVNAMVGIVVLVATGLLLIPAYGATGAALAMAVAHFVSSVATSFLFRTTWPIGWLQLRGFLLLLGPPGQDKEAGETDDAWRPGAAPSDPGAPPAPALPGPVRTSAAQNLEPLTKRGQFWAWFKSGRQKR